MTPHKKILSKMKVEIRDAAKTPHYGIIQVLQAAGCTTNSVSQAELIDQIEASHYAGMKVEKPFSKEVKYYMSAEGIFAFLEEIGA